MKAKRGNISVVATAGSGKLEWSVVAQGSLVRISIIGEIYEGWTSEDFRYQMTNAQKNGAKDVQVYLNTVGGSVFAANEIVNIINDFVKVTGGVVTGRGGAIVASAGTFIAVHIPTFSMASNGSFMIHKPTAGLRGNADDLESAVKLLRNLEEQYAEAYAKRTKKKVEEIKALYEKADYWMTAKEAKEQGFIDSIEGEEVISDKTKAMFEAAGRALPSNPPTPPINPGNHNHKNTMTPEERLRLQAVSLGLAIDASHEDVIKEINRLRQLEAAYNEMRKSVRSREAQERETMINDALASAVKTKRIHADAKDFFKTKLEAATDLKAAIAELEALTPAKSLQEGTENSRGAQGGVPADRANWDFTKWNKEDAKGLQELAKNDEEAYLALYNAHFGTNRKSL
jgi:ATP-dependent protease ClpP protease subunit